MSVVATTIGPRPCLNAALGVAAIGLGLLLPTQAAFAKAAIGGATVVKNDVRSKADDQRRYFRLVVGGRVYRDDLVQTRSDSLAKIVFVDLTNMSVGPDSVVKLDRFVYNGDGTAKEVAINATKGAFRFFSGKSPSRAYEVTTPQAVIGVRGTTYDVRITNGVTLVVLQEGEVNVCVNNNRSLCRTLNQSGQSVSVNDNDISPVLPPGSKPWDFAAHCMNGASDLCNKTTQFALAPLPPRKAAPKRRAQRPNIRPQRQGRIRPSRPSGGYDAPPPPRVVGLPVYDPPPRRVIVDEPIVVRPPRCYPGSRHPRCRIVRPRPCHGYWRRGRCVQRPIVRPPDNPCKYSRRGCGVRPPHIRPPRHVRPPHVRPPHIRPPHVRPPRHVRPHRPIYRPGREGMRPGYRRPAFGGRYERGGARGAYRQRFGGRSGGSRGGYESR